MHRHQKHLRRARSRPISLSALARSEVASEEARHELLPTTEPNPAQMAAAHERADELRGWIDRLPERQRHVILLRFYQGASLEEMALALRCPVGTIKSRLHHALERLRKISMNLLERKRDTGL